MNNSKKTGLLAIMILWCFGSMAQNFRYPVVARITQNAPYPIYLQDYANPSQTNFSIQLEVRDNSLPQRRVRLRLYISGPSGLIQSTPVVRNERVIELAAGQFYDLPSNDVANYFRPENLIISPAQYSQHLIDGSYQFGVEVIDELTNKPLSSVQYSAPVWLVVNDPPVLIIPDNESVVKVENPQFLNFQWMPRHRNVTDVSYEFSLTEMNVPLDYAGNIQNLFLSQPPFYTEYTTQTQLNYDYSKPPLTPGKIYAYRVRAIAKNGLEEIGMFRNNGYSEIRWFRYVEPILAPYDLKASRSDNQQIRLGWQGYPNHINYLIEYRDREANSDWETVKVSKSETGKSIDSNEYLLEALPDGNYEFRVGAEGTAHVETAWSSGLNFKDPLPTPAVGTPFWTDARDATFNWYGEKRLKNYKLFYTKAREDNWVEFEDFDTYSELINEEFLTSKVSIPALDSLSSYQFKIVGFDMDEEASESNIAYLKYLSVETLFRVEEKNISGFLYWTFTNREAQLGAVSGSPQQAFPDAIAGPSTTFIHNDTTTSSQKYPLSNTVVQVFADESCTILLKSAEAGEQGAFDLKVPAEALRGGKLPDKIYLRVNHPELGEFKKEIHTANQDEINVGDWLLPAPTFRFTPSLFVENSSFSRPGDHTIKVYRRASALAVAPFLRYENFRIESIVTERINNEEFFQVAELKPGQTAAGMFYGKGGINPANEFLAVVEGPSPFERFYKVLSMSKMTGTQEYKVTLTQPVSEPYIYGNLVWLNLESRGTLLKLKSTSGYEASTFGNTNQTYRFTLPLSELDENNRYTIEVFSGGVLLKTEAFFLDNRSIGTRRDIQLSKQELMAVMAQMSDLEGEAIGDAFVEIAGRTYLTNSSGWFTFWAPKNSSVNAVIRKDNFKPVSFTIEVNGKTVKRSGITDANKLRSAINGDFGNIESEGLYPVELKDKIATAGSSYLSYELSKDPSSPLETDIYTYGGLALAYNGIEMKGFDYTLKFMVRHGSMYENYSSTFPLANIRVFERQLGFLGETGSNGDFTFITENVKRVLELSFIPTAQMSEKDGYSRKDILVEIPGPSDAGNSKLVNVFMENIGQVYGVIYEEGTGKPINLPQVEVEFLSEKFTTVRYPGEGGYSVKTRRMTPEENYYIVTVKKEGYQDKVVHIAASAAYGNVYRKDIYLKKSVVNDDPDMDPELRATASLFGFKINFKYKTSNSDGTYNIEGILSDANGSTYSFSLDNAQRITLNTGGELWKRTGFLPPDGNAVILNAEQGEFLYANAFAAKKTYPFYLKSGDNSFENGVIYTGSFNISPSELSENVLNIYNQSLITNTKMVINPNLNLERLSLGAFPVAHCSGQIPISEITLLPAKSVNGEIYDKLDTYYSEYPSDKAKLQGILKEGASTKVYLINQFLFTSLTARPEGFELNNAIVMPLMSIPNVFISLMDIDKVRLAGNDLEEIQIVYLNSPRTITISEDAASAQIEEVFASGKGIDLVYVTNSEANKIKPNTESISEINYFSNGIFYSDFLQQKEVVQTASILIPVYMMSVPTPAMGPGNRINLIASIAPPEEFYISGAGEKDGSKGKVGSEINPEDYNNAFARFVIEGDAELDVDPHLFKYKWRYMYETYQLETLLTSFTPKNLWGTIYRPYKFEGVAKLPEEGKKDSFLETTEVGDSTVTKVTINEGLIVIAYSVGVPILGGFNMECRLVWNNDIQQYVRTTSAPDFSVGVQGIFQLNVKPYMLHDSTTGDLKGFFMTFGVQEEIFGMGGAGSGGYVTIDNSPIFGAQFSAQSGAGVGSSAFKLYGAKVGFLYDGAGDAFVVTLGASMGFGQANTLQADATDFLPGSREEARYNRRRAQDRAVNDRWQVARNDRDNGNFSGRMIALDNLFFRGNSAMNEDAETHKININNAEVTLSVGVNTGFTLTGAGTILIEGVELAQVGFLFSITSTLARTDSTAEDWRVFVGMPSFTKATAGPFTDLSANLQLDFGSQKGLENFFIMGAIQADWPVHPIVTIRLGAKFVLGINAENNGIYLAEATGVGGNTLSTIAAYIVGSFGSDFNAIAEQSIAQRNKFFGAIPPEFNSADSTFSAFYIGLNASVILGINKGVDATFFTGDLKVGIGLELAAGLLKALRPAGTEAPIEVRFKAGLFVEIILKTRAPVEANLINITLNLPSFCAAGYQKDSKSEWVWKTLVTFISIEEVIGVPGAVPPGEITCNTIGFVYWKPCLYIYYYRDPDYNGYEKGKLEVATDPRDPYAEATCPIQW